MALVIIATFALTGCTSTATPTAAPEEVTSALVVEEPTSVPAVVEPTSGPAETTLYKVGILAPAVTHCWVAAVACNAEQRCKELADTVEYKLYTSSNAEEMTTRLDDLSTWGCRLFVAFPQWEGMEMSIQAAIDKGVTVVNFDIEIAAKGVYRVAGDNEDMGIQGAKHVVMMLIDTGPMGILRNMGITGIPAYIFAILLAIVFSVILGEITGVLIMCGKLPPFIATLGTMKIFRSVNQHFMQGYTQIVPKDFLNIASFRIGG